ncbi:MAG TPA: ABC transporter permease [Kofleriaceae bacterium]|jgi:peptide/nickel transport system permease protein
MSLTLRFVVRRVGWAFVVAWFAISVTFAMVVAIPADPAKALLGPHATEETIKRVQEHYCLDRGFAGQYACWMSNVVHGDLGESYRTKRPVTEILAERIGPTVMLALAAIFLQIVIGVPLGIIAAWRKGQWPDRAAGLVGLIGQSAPPFFVGTLVLYLFAFRLGWFPISGYGSGLLGHVRHLVLPAMTLATVGIALYARVTRSELIDSLGEDYVRTARAKGVRERDVLLRHALRPALGPLVTLIGVDLGVLVGGAVVVEYIFAWPGLGREVLAGIFALDLPLILGVVLISAFAIAIANLFADLAYLWLDPRLRDR